MTTPALAAVDVPANTAFTVGPGSLAILVGKGPMDSAPSYSGVRYGIAFWSFRITPRAALSAFPTRARSSGDPRSHRPAPPFHRSNRSARACGTTYRKRCFCPTFRIDGGSVSLLRRTSTQRLCSFACLREGSHSPQERRNLAPAGDRIRGVASVLESVPVTFRSDRR
jgi:hypothetical protein